MDSQLVLFHFETVELAEATMSTIRTLEAEGFLELDDAALITRGSKGELTVTPQTSTGTTRTSAVGATIGLVAGTLLGLPVLGAIAGGGIGAKKSVTEAVKKLDGVLDGVGRRVESGSTVLALAVRALPDAETVVDRLSIHRDDMTQVEIPAELRQKIEGSSAD
ncbi:MAG: DUF1269 domain-containing protein [Acidimicrobiales bacterium]